MKRIEVGAVTLVWGNASEAKAALREESRQRFQQRPLAERLAIALWMVRRQPPGSRPPRAR